MSKQIFIIGANSAMARSAIGLLAKDNKVVTAGRHDCDVYCDISKVVDVPEGTDVVVNFAASFGDVSDEEVLEAFNTNVLGTLRICQAAKKAGASHVVLISSMSAVHDERSPYFSIYAITKRQADEAARYYCDQNDIRLTILRPTQVYGNGGGFAKHQPFFYDIVDKTSKGKDLAIYGSHDAKRNYIHADDLSEIIRRVIGKRTTGTYPCMYPSDVTYSEIIRTAQKVFGSGGTVRFLDDKPDIPDNVFENDLTIYDTIEYRPKISLEDGIRGIQSTRSRPHD